MKTLVAVFGHYDSRGGTTAIPIESRTLEAVKKACESYDENGFCWSESNPEPDWIRPSQADFIFVAELHHADDAEVAGDLVGDTSDVLIDETTEPTQLQPGDMNSTEFFTFVGLSLQMPTQLELVQFEAGADADVDDAIENLQMAYRVKYDVHEGFNADWTSEQTLTSEILRHAVQTLEAYRDERKTSRVQFISNAKTRRWDDDAFGFLVTE